MDMIPQDDIPRKQCFTCKEFFPSTPDFFSRDKPRKDGLSPYCHKCRLGPEKYARRLKRHSVEQGEKLCSKCYNPFPGTLEFFHSNKSTKDGLSQLCKGCSTTCSRTSKRLHKKEIRERDKVYEQTHKDQIRVRKSQHYYANHEEIKARDKRKRATPRYKMIHCLGENKRRSRKRAVEGTLTSQQIQNKLKSQKHQCYYCSTKFEMKNGRHVFHLEHTIPLSRTEHNPRHDVNYVVLACPTCNFRKHDKLPHEFFEGGRLF